MGRFPDLVADNGMVRLVAGASFLLCASFASLALASPSFPAAVKEHLELACEPDCTTCHTRPEGGLGTARQPFGLAMQQGGLSAGQPSKIAAALDHLESIQSDVDGDGTPDVEELKNLANPNAADEPLKCFDDGNSDDGGGCAVGTAHASGDSIAALSAVALIGLLVAARRRR